MDKRADALIRLSCGCFYVQKVAPEISVTCGEVRSNNGCRLCGKHDVAVTDILVLQIEDAEKWT